MTTAILDIDGTLVDTNYQHTISWGRAFARYSVTLPLWRIHRHIGMGGDQLVPALGGDELERDLGDDLRDAEQQEYTRLIDEVSPVADARELLISLRDRHHTIVLASSAKQHEVDHYLDLLRARDLADAWTTSSDVQHTKPSPDLVSSALQRVDADPQEAVMVGDTPWDVRAAAKAGVETITVITGGFSEQQLIDAGAVAVYESVAVLRDDLDNTRFRESETT